MASPCALCARKGATCCTGTQILLTSGDVKRITAALLRNDFYMFQKADEGYLDPGDDPLWTHITIRPDGSRRVLLRDDRKHCSLLGPSGCSLPMNTRPLVCRIYPVAFTTDWIDGIDPSCPIAHTARASDWLSEIGMSKDDARKWHRILMDELFAEFGDPEPRKNGVPAPTVGS